MLTYLERNSDSFDEGNLAGVEGCGRGSAEWI
jgi:hypothetical protein